MRVGRGWIWGTVLLLAAALSSPVRSAPAQKRLAFLVDSWYPHSHADVIGTRFLEGYRVGDRAYPSPVTVGSVWTESPRPRDMTRTLAAKYGFRIASSVADALMENAGGRRLAADGVLIATREDLPERGTAPSPTPRLQVVREVLRILDQTGSRVPVFIDKMVAANWPDSQTIVSEAARRGVPLMGGSVLPYVPLDRPLRTAKVEVAVAVASTPYRAFAIHAAELLQGFLEQRGPQETGISSLREVGLGYWSLPDRDRWGAKVLDALIASAKTRRARAPVVPAGLGPETTVVLIQYVDGTRAVLAFIPRVFDDKEFLLGAQYGDGSIATSGLVLQGEPFDHFGYLVHALVEFYTTGRPVVPIERTLLTTGLIVTGQRAREAGGPVTSPPLTVSYQVPRRPP